MEKDKINKEEISELLDKMNDDLLFEPELEILFDILNEKKMYGEILGMIIRYPGTICRYYEEARKHKRFNIEYEWDFDTYKLEQEGP